MKDGSNKCNLYSSSGGGFQYEYQVLTSFVVLMLTRGYVPMFPNFTIDKISFQTNRLGNLVDDFLIELSNQHKHIKILGQIKHTLTSIPTGTEAKETIKRAWQDYNNPNIFNRDSDCFFIITDTLHESDYKSVLCVLEKSRILSKDKDNYFDLLKHHTVIPSNSRKKFDDFKRVVIESNNGIDISDDDLFTFLQHVYILRYDLGRDESVIRSLLLYQIAQFENPNPVDVWNSIYVYTEKLDVHGANITYQSLPDDIKGYFTSTRETQPTLYLQSATLSDFSCDDNDMPTIIPALLLGAWDENYQSDKSIIEELVETNYNTWIKSIQRLAHKTNSPFKNTNAIWTINNTQELIKHWESWFFDNTLTSFVEIVSNVFRGDSQSDNQDNCKYYSKKLCNGIATTVAILSSMKNIFTHVTADRIDYFISRILNIILVNSNINYWANIEDLLPLLAEASPSLYLNILEESLSNEPSPIKELFSNNSIDYNTDGIIRSLEILAWTPEYFKKACEILAHLASIDNRTAWWRRPINSLRSILMPWHPHTLASISDRIRVLNIICEDYPDFAWEFLPDLLPNSHVSITRTTTPKYLTSIPENIPYPTKDEWQQTCIICEELIIQLAIRDSITDWDNFITILPDFSDDAFNKFINNLQNNFDSYSEAKKISIWESLSQLVIRHKNHKDDKWAMGQNRIEALDSIVEQYKPDDLLKLYKRIFDTFNYDLISIESDYDYDAYRKELECKQKEAIQDIYNEGGLQRIIEFVHIVRRPACVGYSMGTIETTETDHVILAEYLNSKAICEQEFIKAYIIKRFYTKGWSWVKAINPNAWTINAKTTFLCCLPLGDCTWALVNNWLGDQRTKYWEQITIYRCLDSIDNQYVIRNLLSCKRYDLLISILWDGIHNKKSYIKINDIIQTLINLETWDHNQLYTISKLIEYLQSQPDIDIDTMFDIELKYYTEDDRSFSYPPINIERKLIKQPNLFCKYLELVSKPRYRYNTTMQNDAANIKDLSDIYNNFSDIFDDWTTIPGTDNNGCFSPEEFQSWFESVSAEAAKIGIEKKLKETIGAILTKAPADDDGFWIHHTIAKLLNQINMQDMRDSYYLKKVGVYRYTYSEDCLQDEQTKADTYIQLAKDSETRGYNYLAELLNRLAGHHQGIINEIRQRLEKDKKQYGE
ncbi:MAG: hypothetical protein IJQ39_10355 [Thermoguttaceae bacterium]|nr:hypothetical protein [Thermoguttaceae bacterium]